MSAVWSMLCPMSTLPCHGAPSLGPSVRLPARPAHRGWTQSACLCACWRQHSTVGSQTTLHGWLTGNIARLVHRGWTQSACVCVCAVMLETTLQGWLSDNIARLAHRQYCTVGSQTTLHGWLTRTGPSQRVCVHVQSCWRQYCTVGSQTTLHGWLTRAGTSQRVCVHVQSCWSQHCRGL